MCWLCDADVGCAMQVLAVCCRCWLCDAGVGCVMQVFDSGVSYAMQVLVM